MIYFLLCWNSWALIAATKQPWAPRGATVNTIAPGAVFNGHSDEFQRRVGELIMLDRMAKPDEIADAMLFRCSAQAGYMTGQLVNVDGGFSGW